MYKLVHTHTKSAIAHALSYACSKSRERYHNSCNTQEKK